MATDLYEKISGLEREVQRLKARAFFELPRGRGVGLYPEADIMNALKRTRGNIWRARYAKKSARLS